MNNDMKISQMLPAKMMININNEVLRITKMNKPACNLCGSSPSTH